MTDHVIRLHSGTNGDWIHLDCTCGWKATLNSLMPTLSRANEVANDHLNLADAEDRHGPIR